MKIKLLLFISIVGINSICIYSKNHALKMEDVPNEKQILLYCSDYLKKRHIKWRRTCLAQFILESGHFKDALFKNHNNPAGMKLAGVRPQIYSYILPNKYIGYMTLAHALEDYILFYSHYANYKNQSNKKEWYRILTKYYNSKDKNYIKKIIAIEKTLTINL